MSTADLPALLRRAAEALENIERPTNRRTIAAELRAAADEIVALPEQERQRMIVLDEENRQDIARWTARYNEHVANGEHLQAERTKWMIDTLTNDPPHRRYMRRGARA